MTASTSNEPGVVTFFFYIVSKIGSSFSL